MGALLEEGVKKAARKSSTKSSVKKIVAPPDEGLKSKSLTIRVNPATWDKFKIICRKSGSTANGMVNQLITQYVLEREKELKDLDAI